MSIALRSVTMEIQIPNPRAPLVLVVDDEPLVRLIAVDVLEEAGFRAVEAADGQDALAKLRAHPEVALLLTDINMPGPFDGVELARRVAAERPGIALIVTSGRMRPRAEELPDDSVFLPKPYDIARMAALARAVTARRLH